MLGEETPAGSRELPPWAETLGACVEAMKASNDGRDPPALDPTFDPRAPLPFEDFFPPFLRVARERLAARPGPARIEVGPAARRALERGLLCWLSFVAAPTLELELSCFRALRRSGLARLGSNAKESRKSTVEYRAFLASLRAEGAASFLVEYAALARRLGTLVEQWVDTTDEMLCRLAEDAPAIRATFGIDAPLGGIVEVDGSIADRHHGGRSVFILRLECGLVLVYKPRSLAIDRAWFDLLAWCHEHGFERSFLSLRIVERERYGWIEHANTVAPADPREARRYFRSAGEQLCLLHLLQATDLHFENLVPCGDQPVLVDVETLFHPELRPELRLGLQRGRDDPSSSAHDLATAEIRRSVLRTGLLPRWQLGDDADGFDLSGLGVAEGAQETTVPARRWRDLNTDAMRLDWAPARVEAPAVSPWASGLAPEDSAEEVVAGYREMADFVRARRSDLLAEDGPLRAFRSARTRVLLRPTQVYAALQARTLAPDRLRLGVERGRALAVLDRAFDSEGWRATAAPLVVAEKRAIEDLDIPLFESRPEDTAVRIDGREVEPGVFARAGFESALESLRTFDDAGAERQVERIRGAFAARRASRDLHTEPEPAREPIHDEPLPGDDLLLERAAAIARRILAQAIRAGDGALTWIAPRYCEPAARYQLEPLDAALYDGLGGIAVFLAAVAAETGEADFREAARGAWLGARQRWRETNAPGPGGAHGLGGWLYATIRVGTFLDDATLRAQAVREIATWDPNRLAADRRLDLLSGTAGALLGLLAVHQAGEGEALGRAIDCGHHLLEHFEPRRFGRSGAAHGVAGIALALGRLAEVGDEPAFARAARRALAWERDSASRNGRRPVSWRYVSWCHGATGVDLARLDSPRALHDATLRREIEEAVARVRGQPPGPVDSLCCGHAGTSELLLTAGRRLGRHEWIAEARRTLAHAFARTEAGDAGTRPPGCFQPGLYQGLSGIGYQLLRLRAPERLPSPLSWR